MCLTLGVNRGCYYEWLGGKTHVLKGKKAHVAHLVGSIFKAHQQRYGARRIEAELKDLGVEAGRWQIRSRMAEQRLKAIQPRSFVPKTTKTNPNLLRSENLLLQMDRVNQINLVWVGDITYLPLPNGKWAYLATWMDLFSRLIVGWKISLSLSAELVIRSFEKALHRRKPPPGLIVHSDGGGQYMDTEFRQLLIKNKCQQSMTRVDNHYDNAFAESLFSRFKAELLRGGVFQDLNNAIAATFEYIEAYYNPIRRHSALNYRSPQKFEFDIAV
jgi:putative transposase